MALAAAGCSPAPDEPAAPVAADAADASPLAAPVTPPPATPPVAPPPADDPPGLPPELASFECAGSAPDWTLALSAAGATLSLDGVEHRLGGELRGTDTGAWTWLGAPDAMPDDSYALLLVPSACFPGEGRPAQAYIAELSLPDGRRASGCCNPATRD